MRMWAVALLVSLTAAIGCSRGRASSPQSTKPLQPSILIHYRRLALEQLESLPLAEARARRPEVFRLKPDRRFLIALAEVKRLMTGIRAVRLDVSSTADGWRIASDDSPPVVVAEIAGYPVIRGAVAEWAGAPSPRISPASAVPVPELAALTGAIDRFEPPQLQRGLEIANQLWGKFGPRAEVAAAAARAFMLLSLQSVDTLEMADLVRGRALALRAIADSLGAAPSAADDALLAFELGYRADASVRASDLSDRDPVGLFVTRRWESLRNAASAEGAGPLVRYLALYAAGLQQEPQQWKVLAERSGTGPLSTALLKTAFSMDDFAVHSWIGTAAVHAARSELASVEKKAPQSAAAQDPLQSEGFVGAFESELNRRADWHRGPLWDGDAFRAYYRGIFYSGLYRMGRFALDELSSVEGARELADFLQRAPSGPAAQFARWYADLSSIKSGQPVSERQFEDLVLLTDLGAPALEREMRELIDKYVPGRDVSGEIGARMALRLDSRPSHVAVMSRVAADPLLDFRLVERICRGWIELRGIDPPDPGGRCLGFIGDAKMLLGLATRRDLDPKRRAEAFYWYTNLAGASERISRDLFRELARQTNFDDGVVDPWVTHLRDKVKNYPEAQGAVEGWLAHHDASAGLAWHVYRARFAHLLVLQGRAGEAWRVIQPSIVSEQGEVMTTAAEILEKLGRSEESSALARQAVDRYPDSGATRAVLAELLWRRHRYSEAALVLEPQEETHKVNEFVWREDLAKRFPAVFRSASDEEVIRAFDALRAQGIWFRKIAHVIPAFDEAGRHDLAFRLHTSLPASREHAWVAAAWQLRAFEYLRKARGRPEAVAWIRQSVTKPRREASLESFFDERAYALLWDLIPPEEEPTVSEWVWLLRAGATHSDADDRQAHRAELLQYFREPRPGDAIHSLGRHLLGLEERASILASARTPVDRCNAAYFLGLEDLDSGRYEDASDWYTLVFETCTRGSTWKVANYARSTLSKWYTSGHDVRAAAAQKLR